MSRSVLLIALAFPPQNSSGTFRSAKFAKYLGEFGWEVVVVTLDWARVLPAEQRDEDLLKEIPSALPIYRLAPFNPVQAAGARMRHLLGAPRAREISRSGLLPPSAITYSEIAAEERARARIYRMLRGIYHFALAPVGDEHFYWALRALPACARIARRHRAEVILVSASPWTSALLGVWLKWWLGRPLVVDFRDYWTQWPIKARRRVRDRLDALAERWVLRSADRLICVHHAMAEDFARQEPEVASKCVVIPNGYDEADFREIPLQGCRDRAQHAETTLVHTGLVWGDAARPLLEAVAELRQEILYSQTARWRVHFVGGLPPSSLRFVQERSLQDLVTVTPRTTHREALARMKAADVLLLLLPNHEGSRKWYPGKLFEYMAAGRPVLGVTPKGLASALISEAGIGVSVEPGETAALRALLRQAACDPQGFARQFYHPRMEVIRQYERRALAQRLASVLEDIVEQHHEAARRSG